MRPQNRKQRKDVNNESKHEEPSVMYNPVVKEPIYFKIFECGKNILNSLDAACKRACMATSRDKYYTKMYKNLIDYNDRNDATYSNENIR